MQLSLRLLGPLQISVDGQLIPESRSKKIEALLVYLVMESQHASQRAYRRENLVGLLFPDMPDEAARTNLRQTLTRLRRAIQDQDAKPPFLLATRESTQFNRESDYDLDVAGFEAALGGCEIHQGQRNGRCPDCMARLTTGLTLYRGPFLDGFFLEDSAVFDEWVLAQRESWQQAALAALQQLADYHERRGEYADASRYAQRRLEIEPWDETALRQLLRLLAYQGQRTAALARFQAFADLLAEELGVEPEAETLALRRQIAAAKETRPAHLPPREPTFIGRAEELGQIRQQLADPGSRLVTLVGPGGIGKTRLAIETGWRVADDNLGPFWHGVTFVSLAGVMAAETGGAFNLLITAVAESLGFTFAGAADPQTQLLQYLADKSLLLILDNFEHLTLTGRDLLLALLKQTRNLKILVTSRERLHLTGEWVLEIDGLPVPPPTSATEAETYGAVALFVQRARQKDARFVMSRNGESDDHACRQTAVVRICRLLHGIPLAIELATTWVRLLPCDDIVQEIERNLDALTSQLHDLPERHRSLRAVFEHSWQLLTPDEQQAVRRLAYFRGGFSREAALAVAKASLPQVAALLDKSLLQRIDVTPDDLPGTAVSPTHTRYQMLEVLRQYAYEKLAANPAEADAVREDHARYYLAFLQQRAAVLRGHGQQTALDEIRLEMENIRLAWQQALAQGDWPAISQAVDTLSLLYYMRSWFAEGAELFTQAANRLAEQAGIDDTAVLRGKLLARQGWFTFLLGHADQAQVLLEESREWLRPFPDSPDHVYTLVFLAVVTYNRGDLATAVELAQTGLAISQRIDDRYYEAIANNILSQIAYLRGDYTAAKSYCETSLAIEREIGNRWSMGFSLANLGRVAYYALGDFAEAQERYQESLVIREALRDGRGQAICHNYLGDTARALGDLTPAADHYQASLAFSRDVSSRSGMIFSLNRLGHLWLEQGETRAARSCFDEALRLAQETQVVPQLLESLAGVAALLAENEPGKALALAHNVAGHPAATPESQAQAAALQERLRDVTVDEGWRARPLTDLVQELL